MNLGLTLEIVILSRHGSVAPYVTLALRVTIVRGSFHLPFRLIALRLAWETERRQAAQSRSGEVER